MRQVRLIGTALESLLLESVIADADQRFPVFAETDHVLGIESQRPEDAEVIRGRRSAHKQRQRWQHRMKQIDCRDVVPGVIDEVLVLLPNLRAVQQFVLHAEQRGLLGEIGLIEPAMLLPIDVRTIQRSQVLCLVDAADQRVVAIE